RSRGWRPRSGKVLPSAPSFRRESSLHSIPSKRLTMRDGWEVKSVADLCSRVTSGGTPSRKQAAYYAPVEQGTPWIKTKELTDSVIHSTEEHISEAGMMNSSAKLLPEGTVLMAMYGATVGKLGILGRPMTCNQAACAMIVDPSTGSNRFLFYR